MVRLPLQHAALPPWLLWGSGAGISMTLGAATAFGNCGEVTAAVPSR